MKSFILKDNKLINGKVYPKGTSFVEVQEKTDNSIELSKSVFLEGDTILKKGTLIEESSKSNSIREAFKNPKEIMPFLPFLNTLYSFFQKTANIGRYIEGVDISNAEDREIIIYTNIPWLDDDMNLMISKAFGGIKGVRRVEEFLNTGDSTGYYLYF